MGESLIQGLQIGGGIGSAFGQYRQGEAARDAARFNADVIARRSQQQIEQIRSRSRRNESTNVTRVAKSGVRLAGSPLSVLADNANNTERQADLVRQSFEIGQSLQRARGQNARGSARVGIASELLGTVSRSASIGLRRGGRI